MNAATYVSEEADINYSLLIIKNHVLFRAHFLYLKRHIFRLIKYISSTQFLVSLFSEPNVTITTCKTHTDSDI